jgi:hypothetical protein
VGLSLRCRSIQSHRDPDRDFDCRRSPEIELCIATAYLSLLLPGARCSYLSIWTMRRNGRRKEGCCDRPRRRRWQTWLRSVGSKLWFTGFRHVLGRRSPRVVLAEPLRSALSGSELWMSREHLTSNEVGALIEMPVCARTPRPGNRPRTSSLVTWEFQDGDQTHGPFNPS